MTNEPRKATDVLLSLETKIDQLISLYRSQDLVLKVLSNKLNSLVERVDGLSAPAENSEASDIYNPHNLGLPTEFKLPEENNPKGFRRTSRPETYQAQPAIKAPPARQPVQPPPKSPPPAPTNQHLAQQEISMPVQFPEFKPSVAPATFKQEVAPEAAASAEQVKQVKQEAQIKSVSDPSRKIPVQQRLVDSRNKAVFLANVKIIDSASGEVVADNLRTNSMGKWQAPLAPGHYQVKISKQESLSKEKIDVTQTVIVDGLSNTQELPILICKVKE